MFVVENTAWDRHSSYSQGTEGLMKGKGVMLFLVGFFFLVNNLFIFGCVGSSFLCEGFL